jgi:hypothetical protein
MQPRAAEESGQPEDTVSDPISPVAESEESLNAHALRMEKEFAFPDCTGPCESCGRPAGGAGIDLRWSAVHHSRARLIDSFVGIIAAVGIGHGMLFHREIEFITHHSFCSGCSFRLRVKRGFAELLEKFSFAVLLIGILLFVVGLIFVPFVLFKHPGKRELLISAVQLIGGLAATFLGWWGATAPRRRCVPMVPKTIPRKPFILKSVSFSD